ncbi:helix-turn-helix transcriptional regulator [Streptomyces lateritius]|uniref:helix-turn-helix transcriptional regulator n=1 Tax=Streptomyces lateritius TaxID=67313 RepID=UPI001672FB94|nr:LuxR C-terminal-related transcriptional regulator [Streptomyces lateritius]
MSGGTSAAAPVRLHDRTTELAAVDTLSARVAAGSGGVLLISGSPGAGRTALLRHAVREFAGRAHLVAAPVGNRVPWSGVRVLLSTLGCTPSAARRALRSARGSEGLAAAVTALRAGEPLLLCVDDHHLWDAHSRAALASAWRVQGGLRGVGWVVSLARHHRPPAVPGAPLLRLTRLSRSGAGGLLDDVCPSPPAPAVRARLLDEAAGHPGVLTAMARRLSSAQLAGAAPLPRPLPDASVLTEVYGGLLDSLPVQWRRMLGLVALAGEANGGGPDAGPERPTVDSDTVLAAARVLRTSPETLDHLLADGLLTGPRAALRFEDPFLRRAVLAATPQAWRRSAHPVFAAVGDGTAEPGAAVLDVACADPPRRETVADGGERPDGHDAPEAGSGSGTETRPALPNDRKASAAPPTDTGPGGRTAPGTSGPRPDAPPALAAASRGGERQARPDGPKAGSDSGARTGPLHTAGRPAAQGAGMGSRAGPKTGGPGSGGTPAAGAGVPAPRRAVTGSQEPSVPETSQAPWLLRARGHRVDRLRASGSARSRTDVARGRDELVRGLRVLADGPAMDAYQALLLAASLLRVGAPQEASDARFLAMEAAWAAGDPDACLTALGDADAALEAPWPTGGQDGAERDFLLGMRSALAVRLDEARAPLARVVALDGAADEPRLLLRAGSAALVLGDTAAAAHVHARALARVRAEGRTALLPRVLEHLAYAELRAGRHGRAGAHAREGLRAAELTGQHNVAAHQHAVLALVASVAGDAHAVEEHARRALTVARPHGLVQAATLAEWALARAELGRGLAVQAAARLAPLVGSGPRGGHFALRMLAVPCFVEAADAAGRRAEAQAAAEEFAVWAAQGIDLQAPAQLARCRALLKEPEESAHWYGEAMRRHEESGNDFERARTLLAYGKWLRRRRRPLEARVRLSDALVTFERAAADTWAAEARAELRATGGAAGRSSGAAAPDDLTPQQQRIAALASEGATNREIADRLSISPRTVDHHLRNVFARLGVRSRVELSGVMVRAARHVTDES